MRQRTLGAMPQSLPERVHFSLLPCSLLTLLIGCSGTVTATDAGAEAACHVAEDCAALANGTRECVNQHCQFSCNSGFHDCTGACLSDTSVDSCGDRCVACPTASSATTTCSAGACGLRCQSGYTDCHGACVPTGTDCGAACTGCAPPSNGVATCQGSTCDFACIAGFHRCDAMCRSNDSVESCGSACTPCLAPANGTVACANRACKVSCDTGYVLEGTSCVPAVLVDYADISNLQDPDTWVEARIDPSSNTTWYAIGYDGRVARTTDSGSTWKTLCQVPSSRSGRTRLVVSGATDHSAYVVTSGGLLRADDLGSSQMCPLVKSWDDASYDGLGTPVAISPTTGTVLAWTFVSGSTGQLVKSTDHGATWTPVTATINVGTNLLALAIDPQNDAHLLAVSDSTGSSVGLYESTDGGSTWSKRSVAIAGRGVVPRFDGAHAGSAYVNKGNSTADGFLSANGGTSWLQTPALGMAGDWAIDRTTGEGYRMRVSGGAMTFEKAADLRTPSWTTLSTFDTDRNFRIDAAQNTVLLIAGFRLWVSTNGGTNFATVPVGKTPVQLGFSSVQSVDGTTLYATNQGWSVFRSTDEGATWSLAYRNTATTMRAGQARLQVSPANPRVAMVYSYTQNSTYDTSLISTADGFQTATFQPQGGINSWGSVLALSLTDPMIAYQFGMSSAVSTNGGTSWSPITGIMPMAFPNVWVPLDAWVLDNSSQVLITVDTSFWMGTGIYRYDHSSKKFTDDTLAVSSVLGNDRPQGMEAFRSGTTSTYRIIGATGWLAQATDGGANFSSVPGAEGGLAACAGRLITSLATNHDVMATACTNKVHVSTNGGKTWAALAGPAWTATSCSVKSLALAGSHLVIACANGPLVRVSHF